VIADSVELVSFGERMDALVTVAGCDKNLPGMLMAAIRTDLPSVFLYGGSIMPGQHDGRDVTIVQVFEGVGAYAEGDMSGEELDDLERHACPGAGSCGGMFTANTMVSIAEALGMAPLGSASAPAENRERYEVAERAGELAVDCIENDRRPLRHPLAGVVRERDRAPDRHRRLHKRCPPPPRAGRGGRRGPSIEDFDEIRGARRRSRTSSPAGAAS